MKFPSRVGTDENGYIKCFASKDFINSNYTPVLDHLIEVLKKILGDKLHSVYIYGSVGTGDAVLGKSDIDLTVILNGRITENQNISLKSEAENILEKFKYIPKIDFDIGTVGEVLDFNNRYEWGFWIKHMCGCIYGYDLANKFPKMMPCEEIGIAMNKNLLKDLNDYRERINGGNSEEMSYISALKRIIRGAYCVVSNIDKSWAVKKEDIFEILKHYFPEESEFYGIQLLLMGKENIESKEIIRIIDYFTAWFQEYIEGEVLEV